MFQQENRYNQYLPNAHEIDQDSTKLLSQIKTNLQDCISRNDVRTGCTKWLDSLKKFITLYGLRFSKNDHVFFVKVTYELFCLKDMDQVSLEKVAEVFTLLVKKEYLLDREDLELPWRQLYEVHYHWKDSYAATSRMVIAKQSFRVTLLNVSNHSRRYFPIKATQEMLSEWLPMLGPDNAATCKAIRYLNDFLPTNCEEKTYLLWLDELMNYWQSFTNGADWEFDLMQLLSRLASDNAGMIDWTPYLDQMFVHIMASFAPPVTYSNSDIKAKPAKSLGASTITSMATWVVSAMEGGKDQVQTCLDRMISALETYFQPANKTTGVSDGLHQFVSSLCSAFVNRVHLERYNKKRSSKTSIEKRLFDSDITNFVTSLKPTAFLMLTSTYETECKNIFSVLATLRPHLIIPDLLDKLRQSEQSMTETSMFMACLAALTSSARPFIEDFPDELMSIIMLLLPGINLSDIPKSLSILYLMSDMLDLMDVIYKDRSVIREADLDDFVVLFTDKCFEVIDHSSLVHTRHEVDVNHYLMNDEEQSLWFATVETYKKLMHICPRKTFDLAFKKLQNFAQNRILDQGVSGKTLANMCKISLNAQPQLTKDFIPYLCQKIENVLVERTDWKKPDSELQYFLLLLSRSISIRGIDIHIEGGCFLLHHLDEISSVLDKTLNLKLKEEWTYASLILENLLYSLIHVRPLRRPNGDCADLNKESSLKMEGVEWYVPGKAEMSAVQFFLDKYLCKSLKALELLAQGDLHMEKELVARNLGHIDNILEACSEALEAIDSPVSNYLAKNDFSLVINGKPVRKSVLEVMHKLQQHLLYKSPDDTESLIAIKMIYDILLRSFGSTEADLSGHKSTYNYYKRKQQNKMIKSEENQGPKLLQRRVIVQWENQVVFRNLMHLGLLPKDAYSKVFELAVSQYRSVRSTSQYLLEKLLTQSGPESHKPITPLLIRCLEESSDERSHLLKGALWIIFMNRNVYLHDWHDLALLVPALVEAQHCKRKSIGKLLTYISALTNRIAMDYSFVPARNPRASKILLELFGIADNSDFESEICQDFLHLEQKLVDLIKSKRLQYSHEMMAYNLLFNCIVCDYKSIPEAVSLWQQALIHEDASLRRTAFKALTGILKGIKVEGNRAIAEDVTNESGPFIPGLRNNNEWLQYKVMNSQELNEYWKKPFSVKPWLGFYSFQSPLNLRKVDDSESLQSSNDVLHQLFQQCFTDPEYVSNFIKLNSIEYTSGEEFYNQSKALLQKLLYQTFGDPFLPHFLPHIKILSVSSKECDQKLASELIYGCISGSRFWPLDKTKAMWDELTPIFHQILENATPDTIGNWVSCLSAATYKHDPNRLKWLFEILVSKDNLSLHGAFRVTSFLRLLNTSVKNNFRLRVLYQEIYEIIREQWDNQFHDVRSEIAALLSTLMAFDIPYNEGNMGRNFPTIKTLLDEMIPKLNVQYKESDKTVQDSIDNPPSRLLQTAALFVIYYLKDSSVGMSQHFFDFLPFFCQFVTGHEDPIASQYCLTALCSMSTSIVHPRSIQHFIDIATKLKSSSSWKIKVSLLEFTQVFVYTNFMQIWNHADLVEQIKAVILELMSDEQILVRLKAATVLTGLIRSHFIDYDEQIRLAKSFSANLAKSKKKTLGQRHSNILGLCSLVEAYPYKVPSFVPDVLTELEKHLIDPVPIPETVKNCFQEFKRTHLDCWQEHEKAFNEDQLFVVMNLMVAPSYYA